MTNLVFFYKNDFFRIYPSPSPPRKSSDWKKSKNSLFQKVVAPDELLLKNPCFLSKPQKLSQGGGGGVAPPPLDFLSIFVIFIVLLKLSIFSKISSFDKTTKL